MCAESYVAGHARVLVVGDPQTRKRMIDHGRVEGAEHRADGAMEDAAGKVLGDEQQRIRSKTEYAADKVWNMLGGAKDAAREAAGE